MRKKNLLIFVFFFLAIAILPRMVFADTGLIGLWHFDEGSGMTTADSSGNGNTATIQGSLSWSNSPAYAKINYAFSGWSTSNYLSVPDSSSFTTFGNQFSFAFWFNVSDNTQNSEFMRKANAFDIVYSGAGSLYGCSAGQFVAALNNTSPGWSFICFNSPIAINNNSWHYLSLVQDGSNCNLYVDAQKSSSTPTCTGNLGNAISQLRFGTNEGNTAKLYGAMDEVRMYSRALSPSEISNLYNCNQVFCVISNQLTFSNSSVTPSSVTYNILQTPLELYVTVQNASTNSTVGNVYAAIFGTNYTMAKVSSFSNSSGGGVFYLSTTWLTNVSATPTSQTINFYATETVESPNVNQTGAPTTLTINKGNTSAFINVFLNNQTSNLVIAYNSSVEQRGNASSMPGSSDVTFSLFRNNSVANVQSPGQSAVMATGNPAVQNLVLGNGTYYIGYGTSVASNWTAANTTFLTLIVQQRNSQLSLTSSAGWSLKSGQSTTIACSAVIVPALQFDSSTVTNPYSVSPQIGIHSAACSISDTQNYTQSSLLNSLLVSSLIACTTNSTFGWQQTFPASASITTLNFTTQVSQNYVKPDLSDVNVSGISNSPQAWTNFTDGSYLVVNTTGISSFTASFGNYIVQNSWSNSTVPIQNIVPVNGTQINPVTLYNFVDEFTGNPLYPPNSTLFVIPSCSAGINFIQVGGATTSYTTILVAESSQFTLSNVRVQYSPDVYYARQIFQSPLNFSVMNFYMINAFKYAVDRIDFKMLDSTYYNSYLELYKTIQGQTVPITEGYFDASHFFSAFLGEDVTYNMQTVDPSGTITQFGIITVVYPIEKDLSLATFVTNPSAQLIAKNILMNAFLSGNNTQLNVIYNDKLNSTSQLNISVLFDNGTVFQSANYTNTSNVNLAYNTSNYTNQSWTVEFNVLNPAIGSVPISYIVPVLVSGSQFLSGASSLWLDLISIGIVTAIGGVTTRRSLVVGSLLSVAAVGLFWGIGWMGVPTVFVAFFIILLILGIVIYLKEGGD